MTSPDICRLYIPNIKLYVTRNLSLYLILDIRNLELSRPLCILHVLYETEYQCLENQRTGDSTLFYLLLRVNSLHINSIMQFV